MKQILPNKWPLVILLGVAFLLNACARADDPVPTPTPPAPSAPCGCSSTPLAGDRYIYPSTAQLGFDSVRKISQVPAGQLAAMSTLGVIQSLETNPWFFNISAYNSVVMGRDAVLKAVNIGYELNKRADVVARLLDFYKNRYPCCIDTTKSSFDQGSFMVRWGSFDIICAQDDLLNKFSLAEKKEFVKTLLARDDEWSKYPLFYNSNAPNARPGSLFLINRLMVLAQYAPYLNVASTIGGFVSAGTFIGAQETQLILQHAKQFIL